MECANERDCELQSDENLFTMNFMLRTESQVNALILADGMDKEKILCLTYYYNNEIANYVFADVR